MAAASDAKVTAKESPAAIELFPKSPELITALEDNSSPLAREIGLYNLSKALVLSKEIGLDLVEISPKASPPVCKILDYKKFLYEQKKSCLLYTSDAADE